MFLTVVYSYPSGQTGSYRDLELGVAQRIRDVIRAGGTVSQVLDDDQAELPLPVSTPDGRVWVWWKGNVYRDGMGSAVPRALLQL